MVLEDFRVSQRLGATVVLGGDFIEFYSVEIRRKSQPRSKRRCLTVKAPPIYKEAYASPLLHATCSSIRGGALL